MRWGSAAALSSLASRGACAPPPLPGCTHGGVHAYTNTTRARTINFTKRTCARGGCPPSSMPSPTMRQTRGGSRTQPSYTSTGPRYAWAPSCLATGSGPVARCTSDGGAGVRQLRRGPHHPQRPQLVQPANCPQSRAQPSDYLEYANTGACPKFGNMCRAGIDARACMYLHEWVRRLEGEDAKQAYDQWRSGCGARS